MKRFISLSLLLAFGGVVAIDFLQAEDPPASQQKDSGKAEADKKLTAAEAEKVMAFLVGEWETRGERRGGNVEEKVAGSAVYRWKVKGKSIEGLHTEKSNSPFSEPGSETYIIEFDPAAGRFILRWKTGKERFRGKEIVFHGRYAPGARVFHFKVVLPKLPENREVVQRISLLGKRGFVSILEAFDEGKSVTKRKIEGRRKAVLSPLHTFKSHNGHNTAVSWSPDGTRLVSCSFDGTAKVWDTSNGKVLHTLKDQEGGVNFAAWSPDGTRIASRGEGLKIRVKVIVWDVGAGKMIHKLEGVGSESVAWSPDGTKLVSAGRDLYSEGDGGSIRVWDAVEGKVLHTLKVPKQRLTAVAWSPDGSRLVSGRFDGTLQVWGVANGKELHVLKGHEVKVHSVAWSPVGLRFASNSGDGTVRVWDAASGKELIKLQASGEWINTIAWSPDGKRIASCGEDSTLKVWDAASGKELLQTEPRSALKAVAWSPDGSRIASNSEDRAIRVWDIVSGDELYRLKGLKGIVWDVVWSPDGTRVASCDDKKTIMIWSIPK